MDYLNTIIKTILFFLLLIAIIRLLGKREVGEISVFDLVVLLLIADIATLGIEGDWYIVLLSSVSLVMILLLQKLFSFLSLHFTKVRTLVDYKPSIIIYDGKLNLKEMKKQSYTIDDLITQARDKGIMDLSEIRLAILEASGELSVYQKSAYEKIILPVVISGNYVKDNIAILSLKAESIDKFLRSKNIILKDVHYLASDGKNFYALETLRTSQLSAQSQ